MDPLDWLNGIKRILKTDFIKKKINNTTVLRFSVHSSKGSFFFFLEFHNVPETSAHLAGRVSRELLKKKLLTVNDTGKDFSRLVDHLTGIFAIYSFRHH